MLLCMFTLDELRTGIFDSSTLVEGWYLLRYFLRVSGMDRLLASRYALDRNTYTAAKIFFVIYTLEINSSNYYKVASFVLIH